MDTNIGFIGLGVMGRPMALNLIRGGYNLSVYGRRQEVREHLAREGAKLCQSPAALAAASDIIITIVSDTADVAEVMFGPEGVASGVRQGAVVVDMSSISPDATRKMAARFLEQGVEMLDAPVSGGEAGAINAALSIMVGGSKPAFERVLPLFRCLGKNIVHIGDSGAGQVTKACNQLVISLTVAAVAEAFVLAKQNNVDPAKVREALLGGSAYSKVLEAHGERMLGRNFQPGFRARLLQKDLRIVLETAHHAGVALPGAALVSQYLNTLVGSGDGDLDASSLCTILERLNKTTL